MPLTKNERSLMQASYRGNTQMVRELLTARTNVNCQDESGCTPLLYASQENHDEVVQVLLSFKAKLDLADKEGNTPLIIASLYGHSGIVQLLVKAGAQVNLARDDGSTPLFIASQNNHSDIVKLLLAHRAQVNLPNKDGMTPLAMASYEGNTSVVCLLLEAKADTDIQDKDGDTALHNACTSGHKDAVEALISACADMSLKNKDGNLPLDIAKAKKGQSTIVHMLQSAVQKPTHNDPTLKKDTTGRDSANLHQAPPQAPPDKVMMIPLPDIQVGEVLGRGTFGVVFQGTWKSKRIAVKKILHTPGSRMPEDVTTLQSLPPHPHIITYYGIAHSEDAVYIITEFAPKGSLYDHIYEKDEKPTFEQSYDWAWQIAHGMEHLHEHNVIHRDLKSANVLLCVGNVAKIADFGTARYLDHTTQQTDVKGTYRWMSPEVMEEVEARITKLCDAYSYGMVLYELFEHKIPFHDIEKKIQVQFKVLGGGRPTITCSLPPYLENLILACWKTNPKERPTFAAIVIAFEKKTFKRQYDILFSFKFCYTPFKARTFVRFPLLLELREL